MEELMLVEEKRDSEGAEGQGTQRVESLMGALPFRVSVRRAVWITLRRLRYEACLFAKDVENKYKYYADEDEDEGEEEDEDDAVKKDLYELAIRRRLVTWLLRNEEYDAALTSDSLKAFVAAAVDVEEEEDEEDNPTAWSALHAAAYCVGWCFTTLHQETFYAKIALKLAKKGGGGGGGAQWENWTVSFGNKESAFSGALASAAEWEEFKAWMLSYAP
jgi:hypothetical protein